MSTEDYPQPSIRGKVDSPHDSKDHTEGNGTALTGGADRAGLIADAQLASHAIPAVLEVTPSAPCLFCERTSGCRIWSNDKEAYCLRPVQGRGPKNSKDGESYWPHHASEIREARRIADLKRSLTLFHNFAGGKITEIRVLDIKGRGKPHTASGYFDDPTLAARAALQYEAKESGGIYFVLNEVDPDCFPRSPNQIVDYADTTTSDKDIRRRRWLVIDCDPKRPAKVPATDEQVAAAQSFAGRLKAMLAERFGWPAPIEAMSGNGQYLIYGVDLPNDDASTDIVKSVLTGLNALMSGMGGEGTAAAVRVDESMFNAARIVRWPGTMNRKGHSTERQPHRRSRLLSAPDTIVPVSLEQLEAVAGHAAKNAPHSAPSRNGTSHAPRNNSPDGINHKLKVDIWLADRGVKVIGTKTEAAGRAVYLIGCPFDENHGDHAETCVMQATSGALSAKCMHDSCSGRGWQDFKRAIGPPKPEHYDPPLPPRQRQAQAASGRDGGKLPAANGECVTESTNEGGETVVPDTAVHLTDVGNGRRIVRRHGTDLRYCHPMKTWFTWHGDVWSKDNTGEPVRRAKDTIADLYRRTATEIQKLPEKVSDDEERARLLKILTAVLKHCMDWEDSRAIGRSLEMARSELGIPVLTEELDRDPWLFNVQNGTLDLRTGDLREHRRDDLITKIAPVNYNSDAVCPRWLSFLNEIMQGRQHMVIYLQRVIGHALTGLTTEQALWFFYGTGANGKTVFLKTIIDLLGPYAMQAVSDLLMVKKNESHPTERADLFGKRFVATIETDEGQRFAEALMKQLTGGDKIRARFLYKDLFEFEPTHKIFMAANHKPAVRGTDHGAWRRIKLVPFTYTVPEDKKDKNLIDKLRYEWPGILAWAVRGCLDWQRDGLDEPDEVRIATEEYRDEQDTVQVFLDECCILQRDARVQSSALLDAYVRWSGEKNMTSPAFRKHLQDKGFETKLGHGKRYFWHGIALPENEAMGEVDGGSSGLHL